MTTLEKALSKLDEYLPISAGDLTVPLLRALLEHAPTQTGRDYVALEIASCESLSALHDLHQRYLTGLLLPMRAHGGKTPQVSDHPSRPSAMTNQSIAYLIEMAKRDQRVLKDLCLQRDNFRCVITGRIDTSALKEGKTSFNPGEEFDGTIAAHIIPFSIAAKSDKAVEIQRTLAIFEILSRFGGIRLDELNGMMINRVENVFTLFMGMHHTFGTLDAWLEPVEGKEHTYTVRYGPEMLVAMATAGVHHGTVITFRNATPEVPLPDPRYIAIHAACAKVMHASGVAEHIDRYLRDYESLPVLAEDGSSSQLLRDALCTISVS